MDEFDPCELCGVAVEPSYVMDGMYVVGYIDGDQNRPVCIDCARTTGDHLIMELSVGQEPVERVPWSEIDADLTDYKKTGKLLGYQDHGFPVRGKDGLIYWVESYKWMIDEAGRRESRRYRVARLNNGAVECYPFNDPARVLETTGDRGREAEDMMLRLAKESKNA